MESVMAKDKLIVFDTTMRDGEQSPGASMTKEEKLRIARQLERMRVDVIEAGFPAASEGDFDAVRAVAAIIKESTVCGLARANEQDIRRCGEAVKEISGREVQYQLSTENRSGDHIWWISDVRKFQEHYPEWKFRYGLREIMEEIHAAVHARSFITGGSYRTLKRDGRTLQKCHGFSRTALHRRALSNGEVQAVEDADHQEMRMAFE